MRKFSKGSNNNLNKKIELMIKIIIRTDSYLNSANTKSTILLSLASALIVAICINFDKIVLFVNVDTDRKILSFLLSLILLLLILSVIYSLKGITPFIKPSEKTNTFSFIDIAINYKELADYKKNFTTVSDLEFLNQLVALNHNLSKALISKYKKQITAITFIEAAAYVLCFSIYMITLSNF
ncbi:hypothetical protein WCU61_09510 [Pectobacterium versatile]|uniref:hypothetical protein n=1 Tax=Pectobacterium versatile TaxID=2488639 RepID=UPI0030190A5D